MAVLAYLMYSKIAKSSLPQITLGHTVKTGLAPVVGACYLSCVLVPMHPCSIRHTKDRNDLELEVKNLCYSINSLLTL